MRCRVRGRRLLTEERLDLNQGRNESLRALCRTTESRTWRALLRHQGAAKTSDRELGHRGVQFVLLGSILGALSANRPLSRGPVNHRKRSSTTSVFVWGLSEREAPSRFLSLLLAALTA